VILEYLDIDSMEDEKKTVVAAFPVTAGATGFCFSGLRGVKQASLTL
jgi:hypothetical protein